MHPLTTNLQDLAALLPNLSQIRRPSKSAIVNSSIAHIHSSRRHRAMASRELRALKSESDALRRELNEWRDRSGLPRVDEPVRGEAFQMILSGEVEVLSAGPIEEEGADDYDDDGFGDDFAGPAPSASGNMAPSASALDDIAMDDLRGPFAHNVPQRGGLQLQTILPRPTGHGPHTPMVVSSPSAVSFENPAMTSMYEPHSHAAGAMHAQYPGQYMPQGVMGSGDVHDKAAWGAQMFANGPALFTPPTSSHGHSGPGNVSPMNVAGPNAQQQAYFLSLQRQQQMLQQQRLTDDASPPTAGAVAMRRERSGSINSNGSGYASPASAGSYEMPSVMGAAAPGAVPRRMAGQSGWDDGMNMGMGGMNMGMMKTLMV